MRRQVRANLRKLLKQEIFEGGRYDDWKCNLLCHNSFQVRPMNLPPDPSSQVPIICCGSALSIYLTIRQTIRDMREGRLQPVTRFAIPNLAQMICFRSWNIELFLSSIFWIRSLVSNSKLHLYLTQSLKSSQSLNLSKDNRSFKLGSLLKMYVDQTMPK